MSCAGGITNHKSELSSSRAPVYQNQLRVIAAPFEANRQTCVTVFEYFCQAQCIYHSPNSPLNYSDPIKILVNTLLSQSLWLMCVVYDKILINLDATTMTGPTQPTQAGNFSFLGCWTDEKDDRTLSPAESTGAIDVNTCASFCEDYQYMGTEYSDECKLVIFCPNLL